jgi:hypothetical protein
MWVHATTDVERPLGPVFAWYADDHHLNHPRWDPDISLSKPTDDPTGIGTVFDRRNTRYEEPVEGTMEVVEFERNAVFAVLIREGGFEMPGRVTFESLGDRETRVTIGAQVPDTVDEQVVMASMQRSADNIKALMEADFD